MIGPGSGKGRQQCGSLLKMRRLTEIETAKHITHSSVRWFLISCCAVAMVQSNKVPSSFEKMRKVCHL